MHGETLRTKTIVWMYSFPLGALLFFAFATWEACGLGGTGRMLHPEQAARPIAHNLLVTQISKLMIEFALAWWLMLLALRDPTPVSAPESTGSRHCVSSVCRSSARTRAREAT
jgi:hypothetical protein